MINQLKNPLESVFIGTPIKSDGNFLTDINVFALNTLANYISLHNIAHTQSKFSSNSSYVSHSESTAMSASIEAEGGSAIWGKVALKIAGGYSSNDSHNEDVVTICSDLIGKDFSARLDWLEITPQKFMGCLMSTFTNETSLLSRVVEAYTNLNSVLKGRLASPEVYEDKDILGVVNELTLSRKIFEEEYGIGIVTGVMIGGLARVEAAIESTSGRKGDEYNGEVTIAYTAPGGAGGGSIGAAYGRKYDDAHKNISTSITGDSFGGAVYSKFQSDEAARLLALTTKALLDSSIPNYSNVKADYKGAPKLDAPDKPKKISYADKMDKIETKEQAQLYDQLVGFDKWRSTKDKDGKLINEGKSFSDYMDAIAAAKKDINKMEVPTKPEIGPSQPQAHSESINSNEVHTAEKLNSNLTNSELSSASALIGEPFKNLGQTSSLTSEVTDNNNWISQANPNKDIVLAVEIARWQDILPCFSQNPLDIESIRDLKNLGSIASALGNMQVLQNFINMYKLAASFDPLDDNWSGYIGTFTEHYDQLNEKIKGLSGSAMQAAFNDYWNSKDRTPFDVTLFKTYVDNYDLFDNHIGMGGYMVFSQPYSTNPDKTFRVGCFDRASNDRTLQNSTWFTPKLKDLGTNEPQGPLIHNINEYADAIKFYPVLSQDGKGVILMVGDFVNAHYGYQMDVPFFGNELNHRKVYAFDCFVVTEHLGIKEIVFTYPNGLELWHWPDDKNLYTFGFYRDENPVSHKLLDNPWQYLGHRPIVKLHLIPFLTSKIQKDTKWHGYILGRPIADNEYAQVFEGTLSSAQKLLDSDDPKNISKSRNYWTDVGLVEMNAEYLESAIRPYLFHLGICEWSNPSS